MAEEKHEKDINRYSVSRFNMFKECPMKHHYAYVEQLPEPDNEYTLAGRLVHQAIEYILKGKDVEEVYQEWYEAVDTGKLSLPRDQLEYTINQYFTYYYHDYNTEDTILVEHEFNYQLEGDDYFNGKIDQVYMKNGFVGVRDIKSTRQQLKYTRDDVYANNQLLTYVPPTEQLIDAKVNFIEIDEIRLAKLADEVPLIQRGKPSTDKENLSLVTADLYRAELERQNLLDDPKYARVLEFLEQRGHPLFNRVAVQLSNRDLLDTNEEENQNIYKAASLDIKYKLKDKQKCFMCPYRNICMHDELAGGTKSREQLIENMR